MTDPSALDDRDYRRVREATRTYREELAVRLAGEVGLRPAEMASIRLSDAREHAMDGDVHHLLAVGRTDGERLVYVPRDVWDATEKFARERGRGVDDPILEVSSRRIQMLVAEVGDRVTGVSVSSRSLRRTFARQQLEDGVDPRVVRSVGGWSSLDTVIETLEQPDEEDIVRAFANGSSSDPGERSGPPARFETALDAILSASSLIETATSREEVEGAACEALVDAGYDGAWLLGVTPEGQESAVRATAGVARSADEIDAGSLSVVGPGAVDGNDAAVRVGSVRDHETVPGLTAHHVVAEVPVGYGDTSYGTLSVATSSSEDIGDRERSILADFGRRIGQAVAAVTRRRLLRADTVMELEFRTTDEGSFLVETARECGCSFSLEGQAPISERSLALYVRVTGTAPETVVDRASAAEGIERARLIRSGGENAVVELVASGGSMAASLTEFGGHVTEYVVDGRGGTVTAEFPIDVDVRGVVRGVTAAFPDTEFVAKREVAHPVSTAEPLQHRVEGELTDKQLSALRSAYQAGYFDWPRETTAEELADTLDISSPTLHNHLRKAQRKLLEELLGQRSS